MSKLLNLLFVCVVALASNAYAGTVAYVSGSTEPWGQPGAVNGLNQVYGSGNWDRLDFSTAVTNGALGYDALYIDGGNGQTGGFESFVNANRAALESYVSNGGSLFLNAARWSGTNGFNLGFGAALNSGASGSGHIATGQAGHEIFVGTNSSWNGSSFSHDYLTGAGLTSLIDDANNRSILAEMNYGAGHVLFGGLTLAFFGEHVSWSADTNILRNNIFAYVGDAAATEVSEPGSITLLGLSLIGLAALRRKSASAA